MDAAGNINILVIDDDADMCILMQKYLTLVPGIKGVFIADNATLAISKMQNVLMDLVICDYKLANNKNGVQLIDTIIHTSGNNNIKYLLISSQLSTADFAMAYGVVGSSILIKPFTQEKLLQKISSILKIPLTK